MKGAVLQRCYFLGLAFIFSLGTRPVIAAFEPIVPTQIEKCSVHPPRLQGIPFECVRWVDSTNPFAFWQSGLAFRLGQISRPTWQTLMRRYGGWHNPQALPPYDPHRFYTLTDFMPPLIQSLDQHRFVGQTYALPDLPSPVHVVANCWGTLYEILRSAHRSSASPMVLFAAEPGSMFALLRRISGPVSDTPQPGDLLLMSHRRGEHEYLDHTLLVIDQGLFFEKAGAGDRVPYRFVDLPTLQSVWNSAIFTYEYRRPVLSRRTLPAPQAYFAARADSPLALSAPWATHLTVIPDPEAPPLLFWMQPMPPPQLVQGRFQLPALVYQPESLVPSLKSFASPKPPGQ